MISVWHSMLFQRTRSCLFRRYSCEMLQDGNPYADLTLTTP
jgi:hypothetical protein